MVTQNSGKTVGLSLATWCGLIGVVAAVTVPTIHASYRIASDVQGIRITNEKRLSHLETMVKVHDQQLDKHDRLLMNRRDGGK